MSDRTPLGDADHPERRPAPPRAPRWVKVSAVITAVVVVVFVALVLSGNDHGPGRHRGSGGGPSHVPRAVVAP